jgi:Domain of unknown function (DUF4126)
MDVETAVGSVFAAFGLAGAAGLNAWLPLFVGALFDRLDVVDLAGPFDQFSTDTGLVVLAALLVLDFVGDKVPAVDNALHVAGAVIAPASGAALFTGEVQTETDIPTVASIVAGAATAGAVHLLRAAVRAASTVATAGVANPFVSLAEDGSSAALTAISFVLPVLAFLLFVALVAGLFVAWRRRRARVRPGGAPSPSA